MSFPEEQRLLTLGFWKPDKKATNFRNFSGVEGGGPNLVVPFADICCEVGCLVFHLWGSSLCCSLVDLATCGLAFVN